MSCAYVLQWHFTYLLPVIAPERRPQENLQCKCEKSYIRQSEKYYKDAMNGTIAKVSFFSPRL